MLRHSDLVTSSGPPLPLTPSERHGRVPIAVGATVRAGGGACGREKIQPVKGRVFRYRMCIELRTDSNNQTLFSRE